MTLRRLQPTEGQTSQLGACGPRPVHGLRWQRCLSLVQPRLGPGDLIARPTQETDPSGAVTNTTYTDTNYEVKTTPPVGPSQDSREDRPGSYTEERTLDGSGNTLTLTRGYTNADLRKISTQASKSPDEFR